MGSGARKTEWKGVVMLLLTAMIWGSSFVAQSIGMEEIEAFTFNGIRSLLGAAVLMPIVALRLGRSASSPDAPPVPGRRAAIRRAIRNGALIGIVYCLASNLQQLAFNYTGAGKIAFVTALYMFFVPLFGLALGKRLPLLTWICVAAGFVGLYFLCIDPKNLTGLNRGDVLTIFCAIVYAVHILLIERYAPQSDGVMLSFVQFAVAGAISCVLMFLFESPNLASIGRAMPSLLYAGVMSCGVAFTFQILGQRYTEATIASLLMCTESVFGVLSSAVILGERLRPREIFGCAIMFAAILLSQASQKLTDALRARRRG